MNKLIKTIKNAIAFFVAALVVLAILIPAISIKSGETKVDSSFLDLMSLQSISSTLNGTNFATNVSVWSFVLLTCFILMPLVVIYDSKSFKAIGLAFSIVTLSYSLSLLKNVELIKKAIGNTNEISISCPGIVIFLVGTILSLLLILVDFIFAVFSEQIANALIKSKKSTEELLRENANLLKQGLITKEEADARKEKILGVIK